MIGLFCLMIGFFCLIIGLFCLIIGLFCLIIGLLHTGLKFGNSLYSVEFLPQSGDEASQFDKTFSLRFPFGMIGLFCLIIGLFCLIIGLFCL